MSEEDETKFEGVDITDDVLLSMGVPHDQLDLYRVAVQRLRDAVSIKMIDTGIFPRAVIRAIHEHGVLTLDEPKKDAIDSIAAHAPLLPYVQSNRHERRMQKALNRRRQKR